MDEVQNTCNPKVAVFVGMSLDGFIARTNGDLDWMQEPGNEGPRSDYGYEAFMARIDVIVMGRKTFEKVLSFDSWPYPKPVIVLTNNPFKIPSKLSDKVETMTGTPKEVVDTLAKRGLFRLYVDGGQTIHEFLSAGLVDELIISRLPILIGSGIQMFGPLQGDMRLKHVGTNTFPGGMVQGEYVLESRNSQA